MDGLIDQAKSQLWKIVNEMASATYGEGQRPVLEIALYEYGNDGLPSSEGYIRMVTPLTHDLDQLSEDLFKLTTNGGSEFCGQVIHTAHVQLDWEVASGNVQMMFIAGNESFSQGSMNYKEACSEVNNKGIIVNTIFCGNYEEGIRTFWKEGATLTSGKYMNIDQNQKTVYVETPYDDKITQLNQRLNDTYIAFGVEGRTYKSKQIAQDQNADVYGKANSVNRAISKSKHVYSNAKWDLVDASKKKDFNVEDIKEENLPTELKGKTLEEKKAYIEKLRKERAVIQKEIDVLAKQRSVYIANKRKEMGKEQTLDKAMLDAIKQQASIKGFVFK